VQEISLPAPYDEVVVHALRNWFAASVGVTVESLVPDARRHLLRPYTRHLVHAAHALSGSDVVMMQAVLARYASTYLAALDGFDIAVTPTASGPPVRVGHYYADGVEGEPDLMLAWSCYTPWVNLTGQPAVSLPSHLDADGLPYGVQLVGRPRHDAELLALAAQLEAAGLWKHDPPPCWNQ
jgi:amidase